MSSLLQLLLEEGYSYSYQPPSSLPTGYNGAVQVTVTAPSSGPIQGSPSVATPTGTDAVLDIQLTGAQAAAVFSGATDQTGYSDVTVWYWNGFLQSYVQIDALPDSTTNGAWSASNITLSVKAQALIAAGASDSNYLIAYGNATPTVKNNGSNIYPLYDDFLGSSLGSGWSATANLTVGVSGSTLSITPSSASGGGNVTSTATFGPGYQVTARAALPASTNGNMYADVGFGSIGASAAYTVIYEGYNGGSGPGSYFAQYSPAPGTAYSGTGPNADSSRHTFKVARDAGGNGLFWLDGTALAGYGSHPDSGAWPVRLGSDSYNPGGVETAQFDWVKVQPYLPTQPTYSAAVMPGSGGGSGSGGGNGTPPPTVGHLGATPSPLTFGTLAIGVSSGPQPLTLSNSGTGTLTISSAVLSGTNAADFSLGSTPGPIAASSSGTLNVTFVPGGAGARSATLTLTHNGDNSPLTVSLSGSGLAPAHLVPSPTSGAFGSVTMGTSSPLNITLQNTGGTGLTITSMALSGTNAGDFSLGTQPTSIAASSSAAQQITFTPSAAGARSATLTITHSGDNSPVTVALSGTGLTPAHLVLTPTSLLFPPTAIGHTSAPQTISVQNTGQSSATITSTLIGLNPGDFTIVSAPAALAGGASGTISITLTPQGNLARSAVLNLAHQGDNSPMQGQLGARGVSRAGLVPFARLIRLDTNAVVATTRNITNYEITWDVDQAGTLMIEVPIADAGDAASTGSTSFAQALIMAGGLDNGTQPVPMLLEFSLDGGTVVDKRRVVEAPQRTLSVTGLVIQEQGDESFAVYGTLPLERVTYTDVPLIDALGGARGTIKPLGGGNGAISLTQVLPYQQGLYKTLPGLQTWTPAGAARLVYTPIAHAAVATQPTFIDSWGDYVAKATDTIAKRMGGMVIPGDTVQQSARGHYVVDSSDAAANLSATLGGTGYTTSTSIATPAAQTVILGNAGGSPGTGFGFTTSESPSVIPAPEETTAIIDVDQSRVQTDLTTLYNRASFQGGSSNGGFPSQGNIKITGLTTLNGTAPQQSVGKDAYTDSMPVLAIDANGAAGSGLYYTIGDGVLRQWPSTLAERHLCLTTFNNASFYVGTPNGVYTHSTTLTDNAPWTQLGGLGGSITRLVTQPNTTVTPNTPVVFALVTGTGKENFDGIYRYPALPGHAAPSGMGYDGWQIVQKTANIVDMMPTDQYTVWFIVKNPQSRIFQYNLQSGALAYWDLPDGAKATKLQRVITAGNTPQDSIWVVTTGSTAGHPAYFSINTAGTWAPFVGCNQDGSLQQPYSGAPVQVNRATGLGLTLNGQFTSVFLCTNSGLYYSATLDGRGWKSANGQNGLDGYGIDNVSAGQFQYLQGQGTNRLYATNATSLFYSNDSAVTWWDLTKGVLDLGPYFSSAAVTATGDLPSNSIQTIGPMPSSPLGLSGTHIYWPGCLPTGWYWQRLLDGHLGWAYYLVNGTVGLPNAMVAQGSDIKADEVTSVTTASTALARSVVSWLGSHSVAQTTLTAYSSFTQAGAGLRTLRPSHVVPVSLADTIAAPSSVAGAYPATAYVNYQAQPLYVLAHTIRMGRDGGGVAETETTLGPVLRKSDEMTPSDIMMAQQDQINAVKVWGRRKS